MDIRNTARLHKSSIRHLYTISMLIWILPLIPGHKICAGIKKLRTRLVLMILVLESLVHIISFYMDQKNSIKDVQASKSNTKTSRYRRAKVRICQIGSSIFTIVSTVVLLFHYFHLTQFETHWHFQVLAVGAFSSYKRACRGSGRLKPVFQQHSIRCSNWQMVWKSSSLRSSVAFLKPLPIFSRTDNAEILSVSSIL